MRKETSKHKGVLTISICFIGEEDDRAIFVAFRDAHERFVSHHVYPIRFSMIPPHHEAIPSPLSPPSLPLACCGVAACVAQVKMTVDDSSRHSLRYRELTGPEGSLSVALSQLPVPRSMRILITW